MGEKSFLVLLGDSSIDRYRLACRSEKGHVAVFRVQYEAFIDGAWHEIVRYDTAHGFPHRDLVHPDGPEDKTEYRNRSNAEVLTLGQEDIKSNWRTYRERYEREMKNE
jgi:hypothetical protein